MVIPFKTPGTRAPLRGARRLSWWLAFAASPASLSAGTVLLSESDANKVRRYHTDCMKWTPEADFASGSYNGIPLQQPMGLAKDAEGRVYVAEQRTGGRLLRFSVDGVFLDTLGREGVEFSGNPHSLATGSDGFIYLSTAFGANAGKVYRIDPATGNVSLLIGSGLDTPRALAFDGSGTLWLASRGGFSSTNGKIHRWNGSSLEDIVTGLPRPSALAWDPVTLRMLATHGGNSSISAFAGNGDNTTVHRTANANYLGLASIEGHLYFTDYNGNSVRAVLAENSSRLVVSGLNRPGQLLALEETPHDGPCEIELCQPLPGIPLAYSPPSQGLYLGSPMLIRCGDGSLLASHDYYGPASTQNTAGQTLLYRSTDEGQAWQSLGDIRTLTQPGPDNDGVFWHGLFARDGDLFSMGAQSAAGHLVIRHSSDHGASWTDVNVSRGTLVTTANNRAWANGPLILEHAGRFWAALEHQISGTWGDNEIRLIAAPRDSDLLDASSWSHSNTLTKNNAWLGGTFRGWLEASPVPPRDGGLLVALRVDNRYPNGAGIGGKAALIRVNDPAAPTPVLSFSPGDFGPADPGGSGFIDFPGGGIRFVIRYDGESDRYWSICSYIPRTYRNASYNAERFRAVLALVSSENLKDWSVERIVMHDPRIYSEDESVRASAFHGPYGSGYYHSAYGFQYPWFLIEGDDILMTVRTAFCDLEGGAPAGHDANYHLFQRIPDFRRRSHPGDLRATGLERSADGACTVHFESRPACLYRLETSDDLVEWNDTGLTLETPGGSAYFRHHPGEDSIRFYRIAESSGSWLDANEP